MHLLMMFAMTGCQEDLRPRLAMAECSSETIASDGTITLVDYDRFGWPIREEVRVPDAEPVVVETEYTHVAGRVATAIAYQDPFAELFEYDAFEQLEYWETNLAGVEPYACNNVYEQGDVLVSSTCENGITTIFDACRNPDEVTTPDGVESYGYTYADCTVLNGQVLGLDAIGPFAENFQHMLGRRVSHVRNREGVLSSSVTTWDCPSE